MKKKLSPGMISSEKLHRIPEHGVQHYLLRTDKEKAK